jgi:hypothetical protein
MSEPSTETPEIKKQVCEKCRIAYAPEAFSHGVEGQGCVCRRCLLAMGYKVDEGRA